MAAEIPQYLMGIAAVIASLTGVFTAVVNVKRLSQIERERAAESAAHRALHPDDEEENLALEIARDQVHHHHEGAQVHHLQALPNPEHKGDAQ